MNEEIDVGCGREEAAKASDELGSQNDIVERISSRRKMIENWDSWWKEWAKEERWLRMGWDWTVRQSCKEMGMMNEWKGPCANAETPLTKIVASSYSENNSTASIVRSAMIDLHHKPSALLITDWLRPGKYEVYLRNFRARVFLVIWWDPRWIVGPGWDVPTIQGGSLHMI